MNNKSIMTVIVAMLLALLCTVLVFNKKEVKQIPNTSTEIIEKNNEIPLEESTIEVKAEKNVELKKEEKASDFISTSLKKEEKVLENKKAENVIENTMQEASIIEEVQDYGIMKDENGNIIVTRTFGKYPIKYSFRDFGIIDKVTTK